MEAEQVGEVGHHPRIFSIVAHHALRLAAQGSYDVSCEFNALFTAAYTPALRRFPTATPLATNGSRRRQQRVQRFPAQNCVFVHRCLAQRHAAEYRITHRLSVFQASRADVIRVPATAGVVSDVESRLLSTGFVCVDAVDDALGVDVVVAVVVLDGYTKNDEDWALAHDPHGAAEPLAGHAKQRFATSVRVSGFWTRSGDVITSSDTILVIGSQSPLGQAAISSAQRCGLNVVALQAPGSPVIQGTTPIFAALSDPEAMYKAVQARHAVVEHLVVCPTADPLASGSPQQNSSQLLAAFMTAQVRIVSALQGLVSSSGTISLAASTKCNPGSELETWFRKGLAQVSSLVAPRRVFLVVPASTAGDTWLSAVSAGTDSALLHPDMSATARVDAMYRPASALSGSADPLGDLLSDEMLASMLSDSDTQPAAKPAKPAESPKTIDDLLREDTAPVKPARTTAYDDAIASHAEELATLRRSLATARVELEQLVEASRTASEERERAESRAAELTEMLSVRQTELELSQSEITRLDEEINARAVRHAELEDAIQTASSETDALLNAKETLKADTEALETHAESVLEALRNGVGFETRDLASIAERIAARRERAMVAGQELENAEAIVEVLRTEIASSRTALEQTSSELDQLRTAREEASRLAVQLEGEITDLTERHETALERTLVAETQHRVVQTQLEEIVSELSGARDQLVSTESELASAREGVLQAERDMAGLTETLAASRQRQEVLQEEIAHSRAEATKVSSELSRLVSEREGVLSEVELARSRAEAAQAAAERERRLTEEAATEAQARTSRLEADAKAAETRLEKATTAVQEAREELTRARTQASAALADTARAQTEVSRTGERVTELRAEQAALVVQVNAARQSLENAERELERAHAARDEQQRLTSAAHAKEKLAAAEADAAASRLTDTLSAIENARVQEESLREEIASLRSEAEASALAADTARRLSDSLAADVAQKRSKVEAAASELRALEGGVAEARLDLEQAHAEAQALRQNAEAEVARRVREVMAEQETAASALRDAALAEAAQARAEVDEMLSSARQEADQMRESGRSAADRITHTAEDLARRAREAAERDAETTRQKARDEALHTAEAAKKSLEDARARQRSITENAEAEAAEAVRTTIQTAEERAKQILQDARAEAARLTESAEAASSNAIADITSRARRRLTALDRLIAARDHQSRHLADSILHQAHLSAEGLIADASSRVELAETTARQAAEQRIEELERSYAQKVEEAELVLRRAQEQAEAIESEANRRADEITRSAQDRADTLKESVNPIVASATRDAEEIRRTAQADSSELLDEAAARAADAKKSAREDADKVMRDALRDAELIRSRAREEAEVVLQKTRETIAEVRDEASRRKARELADELEQRLSELGNLDDVVETLRSRRREEDLDAIAVDAAGASPLLPPPSLPDAETIQQDADGASDGAYDGDKSLRSSEELDDALSAENLVWAPTPPPGISPEDFATPRKGLFRKKKS